LGFGFWGSALRFVFYLSIGEHATGVIARAQHGVGWSNNSVAASLALLGVGGLRFGVWG
jgi:hypothetical protein